MVEVLCGLPLDQSMAYQGQGRKPSSLGQGVKGSLDISGLVRLGRCSDRGEATALSQLLQTFALDEHHHVTQGGADFNGVALLGSEGEEGAVVGGFDQGHLLEVLCRLRRCTNYGIPAGGRQPSAASAQITVQMMPSSLLAGTQLY